jgi:hypothetical protein
MRQEFVKMCWQFRKWRVSWTIGGLMPIKNPALEKAGLAAYETTEAILLLPNK